MLYIEAAEYFVPDTRLLIEESLDHFMLSKSQAKVYSMFYGLQEIPCAKDMSMVDLIQRSVENLIIKSKINKNDIKYIIHSHTAKVITHFGKSVIRQVQKNLSLEHAVAFGTSLNNCASTLNAFEMADVLLQGQDDNACAIVVTGERAFTPTVQIIPNTSITGDASAAVLVKSMGEKNKLLHIEMLTEGRFSRGIWLALEEAKAFEKSYVPLLANTILKAVRHVGLAMSDIKIILPHNVNLISWSNVAKSLNFPLEKIYLKNVRKYAHCFGSDILINYADAEHENLLSPGDHFIMATVGLGATFAVAVFKR